MTLLDRLLERHDPVESRTIRGDSYWGAWAAGNTDGPPGTVDSLTGTRVDRDTSLGVSATWACISLIADTIATMPVVVEERQSNGRWVEVENRPRWLDEPNTEQTPVDYAFGQSASLLGDGNSVIYNVLDSRLNVIESWPLDPHHVIILRERVNGRMQLVYYVNATAGQMSPVGPFRLTEGPEIFHVKGFGWASSNPRGLSPMEQARRMFGGAVAGQELGAAFFRNGINAPGFISLPQDITDDQVKEFKEEFRGRNTGSPKRMGTIPVLTGGATFIPAMITPEQAQFIELRRFSVEEIARIYRVPPAMVGELSKTTTWGTGIEQMNIGYATYTIAPWTVRLEQSWKRNMLGQTPGQRIRFDLKALMRGDSVARADYWLKMFQVGATSPNDIANAEGFDPYEGGDQHYFPVNTAPIGTEPLKIVKVDAEEPNLDKPIAGDASTAPPDAAPAKK